MKPLRALLVEDSEQDAELLLRHLRREGFDVSSERVDTPEAMKHALDVGDWDVVISDYTMPRFSAMRALSMLRERSLDLPFIIVSGTVEELTGVEAIRAGAHDFMPKGHYARLVPAIQREMRDASLRHEQSKMHHQLIISDRMASVGTLAAGVAHEINNPLTVVMANLEFSVQDGTSLLEKLSRAKAAGILLDPDEIEPLLEEIVEPLRFAQEAAERVRNIVRDLKTFSRADEDKKSSLEVEKVLESSLRIAKNEIRHRANLVRDYGVVPPVFANEGRLGQVFLNLIVNAAQAIAEGNADENEIRITTKLHEDTKMVCVEVRDTGAGIPRDMMTRIFDPFFTTKPVGVGTGLGLAICHRLVVAQGGHIQVESEVGKGTCFRVLLPAAVTSDAVAPPSSRETPMARRAVLVVDDEPSLGASVKRMLSSDHDVTVAMSVEEANAFLAGGDVYDLILCDLMMPQKTGMDFYEELKALGDSHSERMIFMTGGAFSGRAAAFLETVKVPHIEKPFSGKALRTLLRGPLRG